MFVGNKESHIEWKNGRWTRVFSPITLHKIKKHLQHEIAIGSYPIYIKDNIDYCKWICIDIDSHRKVSREQKKHLKEEFPDTWKIKLHKLIKYYKKEIDQERKIRQRGFCDGVTNNSNYFLLTNRFFYEDSGGGFHIWIFPEPYTTLEDCGKYIEHIKPNLKKIYKEFFPDNGDFEIYPRQYSTSHLDEKCGNGVRIPFGKNIGKNYITRVLKYNIGTTPVATLSTLYSGPDVTKMAEDVGRREDDRLYEKQILKGDLEFWGYSPLIRPCYRKIMDGQLQTFDRHGHMMRLSMCHELNTHRVPRYLIPRAFEKQFDYDPGTSEEQVESVLRNKTGDWRWSCNKIKELGYCTEGEDCKYVFKKYREGKYRIRF